MANIEKWLVEIGATNINKQYHDKMCTAITFLHYDETTKQTLAFNLKAQTEEAFKIFWAEVKRPRDDTRQKIEQQALRTAWKILSDWAEIQCTMVLLKQATPLQMFLPYLYDQKTGQTFYDKVISGKGQLLIG